MTVRFGRDALELDHDDGVELWRYEALRQAAPLVPDKPARLMHLSSGDARLVVEGTDFHHELRRRCPDLTGGSSGGRRRWLLWTGAGAMLLLIAAGAAHYFPAWSARLIPAEWERAMGARVIDQAITMFAAMRGRSPEICSEPAGRAVLDKLVARLSATVASPFPYRITVVNLDVLNAIAAPGGHIALFRGLIDQAQSADEVAGVVAHEMGHVSARHVTTAMVRRVGLSALINALTGNLAGGDIVGPIATAAISASYSRSVEADADTRAAAILDRAGIGTAGIAAFFERMAARPGKVPEMFGFLSSHPPHGARARLLRGAVDQPRRSPFSSEDWTELRNICRTAQPLR